MTNATLVGESIPCVVSYMQSTRNVRLRIETPAPRRSTQDFANPGAEFLQDFDFILCGIINRQSGASWLTPQFLHSRAQCQKVARARHLATHILREIGVSFPKIGKHFGRDHTTIMSGYTRATSILDRDPFYRHLREAVWQTLIVTSLLGFRRAVSCD